MLLQRVCSLQALVAAGTASTDRPPHRSVRAELPHTAPDWRDVPTGETVETRPVGIVAEAPQDYLPMLEATMKMGVSRQTVLPRLLLKRGELDAVLVTMADVRDCESESYNRSPTCSDPFHEPRGIMKIDPKTSECRPPRSSSPSGP